MEEDIKVLEDMRDNIYGAIQFEDDYQVRALEQKQFDALNLAIKHLRKTKEDKEYEELKKIESELLIKKIDEMLNEEEDKIKLQDLKIRADALGAHFTDTYIISLRDDYNINKGREQMLDLIKGKIMQIVEGDK